MATPARADDVVPRPTKDTASRSPTLVIGNAASHKARTGAIAIPDGWGTACIASVESRPSFRNTSPARLVAGLRFRGAAAAGTKHEMALGMILLVLGVVPIIAYRFGLASEVGLY